ncbi:MAG: tRNA pseudouridine(38-40) synthase TruA, partial [Anaerolineales bacterium]
MVASNYRATVQYDGTDYSGFQIQPDKRTIQGELERALQRVTQQFVRVAGAGRTDAAVHALGQVISFRANWSHGDQDLQRA